MLKWYISRHSASIASLDACSVYDLAAGAPIGPIHHRVLERSSKAGAISLMSLFQDFVLSANNFNQ